MNGRRFALLFALVCAAASCAGKQPEIAPRQHVLIVAEEGMSTTGVLYRFEDGAEGWETVGAPVPVVFGRGGVGEKVEGDGRSPQGNFGLGSAFGYAESPPEGLRLPYLPLGPGSVCVDDPASADYNRVFDPSSEAAKGRFTSAERMRRDLAYGDALYEFGVVVGYNPDGERHPETDTGRGSCIFLHVWRSGTSPTDGCTAMDRVALLDLLAWLDPEALPRVVQGTRTFLSDLAAAGEIPYRLPKS